MIIRTNGVNNIVFDNELPPQVILIRVEEGCHIIDGERYVFVTNEELEETYKYNLREKVRQVFGEM